jgi:hypothetical protein
MLRLGFMQGITTVIPTLPGKTVTVGSGKNYASLQSAITGEVSANPNLTLLSGPLNIVLYPMNDTTPATVTGFTVDATHYVNILTDSSTRHVGVWNGSKYNLSVSGNSGILVLNSYTRVVGLQILTSPTTTENNGIYFQIGNCLAAQNIIQCGGSYGGSAGIADNPFIDDDELSASYIYNNIIYGFSIYGSGDGIFIAPGNDHIAYVYNNTIVGCNAGFDLDSYRSYSLKNNLISSCTIPIYGGNSTDFLDSGYNATNNASWGTDYTSLTGDRLSQTFTFVNAGGNNYLITSGDTGAYQWGEDLSSDANYPFNTDILGLTRTAPWSIGASRP